MVGSNPPGVGVCRASNERHPEAGPFRPAERRSHGKVSNRTFRASCPILARPDDRCYVGLCLSRTMTAIVVRHKVKDFGKWKAAYDTFDAFHKANGVKSAQVLANVDNPNEILVISEFTNVAAARKFGQLDELRKLMEQAGVADKPDIYIVEHAHHRSFA